MKLHPKRGKTMLDLESEHLYTLQEAAHRQPKGRQGKPTHPSTIYRWITIGVHLRGGEVVRLEGARIGGRWLTSAEAIQRFVERLTLGTVADANDALADEPVANAPPVRRSQRRQQELDRIDRELDAAGI
jgi:hypothetical protein